MRYVLPLALMLLSLGHGEPASAQWGDLKGQIIYDGPPPEVRLLVLGPARGVGDVPDESLVVDRKTGGIANAFVYLRRTPPTVHPDLAAVPAAAKLDCKAYRFHPHVLAVRAGQGLLVTNSDPAWHNVHTYPLKNLPCNLLVEPNEEQTIPLDRAEILPFKITDDTFPWMTGYCFVTDHPYVAVTDAEGRFTIPKLPTGEREFRIWHEKAGYLEKSVIVSVKEGQNEWPVVKVPPSKFKR